LATNSRFLTESGRARFGFFVCSRIIGRMAEASPQSLVLSFEDARRVVEHHAAGVRPGTLEFLPLMQGQGRVLAKPVTADRDQPAFDRAMRDGYAVRSSDFAQLPAILEVVAEIKAGVAIESLPKLIGPGQAAAIMTGAPAPRGADAVVMVEYTTLADGRVTVTRGISSGDNIARAGSEARARELLLQPGTTMDYAGLAVAASVGQENVWVYRRPVVGILSTGDELVALNVTPGPTQIRNSNSYSLAAQIRDAGAEPRMLEIAPDDVGELRELISEGFSADLLLITGGVSMGKYDLAEQVLAELNAEFFFTGAQIQPGRPVVFGRIGEKYFFGLPGNPVSTMVTFALFARPLIDALAGRTPQPLIFTHARLRSEIRIKPGLTRFLPGMLSGEFANSAVELARWHGSGDVASTALANCYVVIPPDRDHIPAGEWMAVMRK
jgi:molybdopterin molybdotransferase